jgi:hypothetical protein
MKLTSLFIALALSGSSLIAGSGYAPKNAKEPVLPAPAPTGCDCFGPGASFDVFAGGIFPDGGDAEIGGGVGLNYFFTPVFGVDVNYGVYATDSAHHQFDANLVMRAPITSACLAPYVLAGGGYATNSSNRATYQVGAGVDIRFQSSGCMGLFVEGLYHFTEGDSPEFTTARVGIRLPF